MKRSVLVLMSLLFSATLCAGVKVWTTGSEGDVQAPTEPGLVLMGGGGDVDEAMRWFLKRTGGGDIVVLRASGSDGYNTYLHEELGVSVNSVRTIRFESAEGSRDPGVLEAIRSAEGIFLAGGDQSRYVRYWKGTAVQELLNRHVREGKPLGGTSAGLAVMGEYAYSAMHEGKLTSELAQENPGHPWITIERGFLAVPALEGILTDTHFSERNRLGRLVVMLRRILGDDNKRAFGLGVDEQTALCIDGAGRAHVFGKGSVHLVDPGRVEVRVSSRESGEPFSFKEWLASFRGEVQGDAKGRLVIVGGGLRAGTESIYTSLIEGGRLLHGGRLGIIPAASTKPMQSSADFIRILSGYGVAEEAVEVLPLAVRDDPATTETDESIWVKNAEKEAAAAHIRQLDAIWFTGGDQSRIVQLLAPEGTETPVLKAVREIFHRGGVVGGTSAGAAVQSEVMILGGSSRGALRYGHGEHYRSMKEQEDGPLLTGVGLGFFPHGLIDQHFDRKARLGRLMVALLETNETGPVGYGIDEDTAFVYDAAERRGVVRGNGSVVVVDVSAAQRTPSGGTSGIRLSVLGDGDGILWPERTIVVNPAKKPTVGREYMEFPNPVAGGPMDPYSGRLEDILGYLLVDNKAAGEVVSSLRGKEGTWRTLVFRQDDRTRGYWASLDGTRDSYTVIDAILDIGPLPAEGNMPAGGR